MRNRFLYYIAGALILLSSCQKSNEKLIDKWIFISISNSCGDRGCKDDIKEVAFLCCFEQNKRYNQFLTFTDENLFKKDLRNKNSDRFYYGETSQLYIIMTSQRISKSIQQIPLLIRIKYIMTL